MSNNGLLIHYEYCTGCHTCEIACKQEHNYTSGQCGIHLNEIVTELPDGKFRIDYLPFPTYYCDLCIKRTAEGEKPSCVKHCQAAVMYYGTIEELSERMNNTAHGVLYTPK